MNLDFDLIFDVLVILMGVLLFAECGIMKSKDTVPSMFIPAAEMNYCTDKVGLIKYLFPYVIGFGVICIGYGVFALYLDVFSPDVSIYIKWTGLVVFIGGWIAFSAALRRAKNRFFNKIGK